MSLQRTISVFFESCSRSRVLTISPTHQSNWRMASPRKPSLDLPVEAFVRHARHVDVVRREEEEESLLLVLFDPLDRAFHPLVREIFIAPARGLPAGEEADAADAVVNGMVVAVTPVHFQRLASFRIFPGGMVGPRSLAAYPERILRVEVEHAVVFDVDARDAVVGRR